MINVAVTGAQGRMGKRIIALMEERKDLKVAVGLEKGASLPEQAKVDALIDFSSPEGTRHWLEICRRRKIAMVIGTTGLSSADHGLIDQAAKDIAVLQAPNMSLGVNLLFKIAAEIASVLGDDYDIEIAEAHHRFKKDAPSGTAMGIAQSILKATSKSTDGLVYSRHGDDVARVRGQIGMHSLRMGDEVGMHTVYFAGTGERIELTHRASTRDTFAAGAIKAAAWLAHKPHGRYTMADVLGLT